MSEINEKSEAPVAAATSYLAEGSDYDPCIGHWWIADGEIKVGTKRKPRLWTRFWFSFFFDIEWLERQGRR